MTAAKSLVISAAPVLTARQPLLPTVLLIP